MVLADSVPVYQHNVHTKQQKFVFVMSHHNKAIVFTNFVIDLTKTAHLVTGEVLFAQHNHLYGILSCGPCMRKVNWRQVTVIPSQLESMRDLNWVATFLKQRLRFHTVPPEPYSFYLNGTTPWTVWFLAIYCDPTCAVSIPCFIDLFQYLCMTRKKVDLFFYLLLSLCCFVFLFSFIRCQLVAANVCTVLVLPIWYSTKIQSFL